MTPPRTDKRLKRLATSRVCSTVDASKYADELKKTADTMMNMETAESKSRFFKALADGIRLRILSLLTARELCVCEIMVALDLTQPAASYHLGILETEGLVKHRKQGKWVFYRLSDRSRADMLLSSNGQ